ncbi:MAG: hypothetical protein ISR65_13475 [Bacteriovoracaceae bacterium]|nr:hypothetical protein [Bacteriovoracaceae bacterium]
MKILFVCLCLVVSAFASAEVKNCTVNSASYSQYPQEGYQVPLQDGTVVAIDYEGQKLNSVLINGEKVFRKCGAELFEISTSEMAKNAFQYTGETNFDRFVGAQVGMCNTVDEGWMVLLSDDGGYLAYMGPYEVPLSLVKLDCN